MKAEDVPTSTSIKFLSGPLVGQTFSINKPITTIGRDLTNDIVVKNDLKVSRYHARLLWKDGEWSIEKLSQSSFLTVNQQKVQQVLISNSTIIGVGEDTSFVFLTSAPVEAASPPTVPRLRPVKEEPPPPSSQTLPPYEKQIFAAPPPQEDAFTVQLGEPAARPDVTQIVSFSEVGLPSLEVTSNSHSDKRTCVLAKPVINIGRDATNDIIINDRIVSGLHLRIVRQGNAFILIHPHPDRPKTLNGLLYQGRKIRGDEQFSKTLTKGDIFRIGGESGTLVTLTYNDGTGTAQELLPAVQPIKLGSPELTIGRKPDNNVVLPHPQVSAYHARLVREGGTYRILDQNSTNHVYVNLELVTNHLLRLGDEIRIGPYRLIFEGDQLKQYDESNFICINAQNLKKTGINNVTLLNNISITIPPRKFVALVGGSGVGKSILMDALNGLRPAQEGKVLYNGQDYYKNIAAFSTQLGYVPQEDIVHRDLTVERALYYAAKLRLPSDFTDEQIEQRIKDVLEDVEMTGRRKLLVRKLSGGQRKRVSIALELLANPSLFFLDEPTSGLDPGLDRKMMYLLRKLADAGHTIVLVTHATNNINTCDYVCFLAQGGRLAYFGPPNEAKTYFGKTDFAEIYTSLEPTDENPDIPEEVEAKYKLSKEYQEYIAMPLRATPAEATPGLNGRPKAMKRPKRGNPFKQFLLLSRRNVELLKNDKNTLILLLLQAPLLALLLVLLVRFEVGTGIFDQNKVVQCSPQIIQTVVMTNANSPASPQPLGINTQGGSGPVDCTRIVNFLKTDTNGIAYAQAKGGVNAALQDFIVTGSGLNAERAVFLIAFIAVLFGVLNGTREIVKEVSIYRRERMVNLGIVPYVLSKILVLGVFALFQSAILLLIVDIFEPFQQSIFLPVLLELYITLALTALAGLLLGLTASAFAPNEDSANSLLPFILVPQLVFAGVEIALKDWILQIPAAIFPFRWAMVALGSSVGVHSDKVGGDSLFGNDSTYHGTLFSTFSQADATNRVLLAWAALGIIIVVLTILICIGLKRKDIRV